MAACCAYQIDEMAVDAAVGGELGMESGGEDVSLLDEDGEAVALGEDVDAGSGLHDARGADVDHFQGPPSSFVSARSSMALSIWRP